MSVVYRNYLVRCENGDQPLWRCVDPLVLWTPNPLLAAKYTVDEAMQEVKSLRHQLRYNPDYDLNNDFVILSKTEALAEYGRLIAEKELVCTVQPATAQ